MPVPAWFESRYPTFCRKLSADPYFSEVLKERFFEEVSGHCDPDSPEFENMLRNIITQWSDRGERVVLNPDEKLGRAQHLKAIESALQKRHKLKSAQLEILMNTNFKAMSNGQRVESLKKWLPDTPFNGTVWSFRNIAEPAQPFNGIDVNSLPCRLGLRDDSLESEAYVFLILEPPTGMAVRRPTAMNAGVFPPYVDLWEPGGETKPRPACEGSVPKGLPEVVHEAVSSSQIKPAFL